MKIQSAAAFVLSALFATSALAAPIGEVATQSGKIFDGENYMVVKKDMKKGETIKPHAHPGFKTLIFAVGKGSFDVTLSENGETEKHQTAAGSVLRFGGDAVIEAVATQDASVTITLVK